MDRDDQHQSIHEISLARRMVMSPGRAEMVTVSSPSLRDGSFSAQEFVSTETGDHFEPKQHHYDEIESESISAFLLCWIFWLNVGLRLLAADRGR